MTLVFRYDILCLRKRKKGGGKMFNRSKFRALVIEQGLTMEIIAQELGINQATLYRKMNGESDFYRWEIQSICTLLDVSSPKEIFFA